MTANLKREIQHAVRAPMAANTGKLPSGWTWKSVGELADSEPNSVTDGPFGSKLKTAHYTRSGPRVIRLTNIGDAEFVDAHAHISHSHYSTLAKHRVFAGDIVIAALGETLPRACLIPESVGPAIVKADCIRFKPSPEHSAKYLNYALNWQGTRKRTAAIVHGVGRPRLNSSEIKSVLLPVAQPNEQRRIVAEIEKQFTRFEAGVAALRRVQANLKRYRAAVLKAACEGRLVPTEADLARKEERSYETGEQLLARILARRRQKWTNPNTYEDPDVPNTAALPALPTGWTWATVSQVSAIIVDCPHSTAKFVADGFPCVDTTCIKPGRILRDKLRYVSATTYTERIARLVPKAGDIVFAREGTVGTAVVIPEDLSPCLGQRVMLMRSDGCIERRYFEHCLNSEVVRAQYLPKIVGSTAPHLNVAEVKILSLPLPPLKEQERIVEEAERRLSVVEDLETVISANLHRAARLRQSILDRAFSGRLMSEGSTVTQPVTTT